MLTTNSKAQHDRHQQLKKAQVFTALCHMVHMYIARKIHKVVLHLLDKVLYGSS